MMTASARRWRPWAAGAILVACAVPLFAGLGHYPLWDDEATTAMVGRNVLRTGDTSAVVGHNIIAYRGGRELENLKIRYLPPLQYYAVAASVAVLGDSNFGVRFPFALAGLLTVVVVVRWLWRAEAGPATWAGLGIALACNVSLFLFCRQCRYYGLALLLTVLVAYLYLHWNGRRSGLWVLALASVALLAAQYLNYFALYAVIALDYAVWQRRRARLRPGDWATLLLPQIVLGGAILRVFNPLAKQVVDEEQLSWLTAKATLLWWTLRDLNVAEFGLGVLLAVAPIVWLLDRRSRLLRGWIALAVYTLVVTLLSPQPVSSTRFADIRYLVPAIPLCAWVGAETLCILLRRRVVPVAVAAGLLFGTNLAYGKWTGEPKPSWKSRGSTIVKFYRELKSPQASPYGAAAEWVAANVPAQAPVWVLPGYAIYPLMFHAPEPLYGYQLPPEPDEQFRELPLVHRIGTVAPDYIVCFGPFGQQAFEENLHGLEAIGARYEPAAKLDVYYYDMTRPELFMHEFRTVTEYTSRERVFIYRRIGAATRSERPAS